MKPQLIFDDDDDDDEDFEKDTKLELSDLGTKSDSKKDSKPRDLRYLDADDDDEADQEINDKIDMNKYFSNGEGEV